MIIVLLRGPGSKCLFPRHYIIYFQIFVSYMPACSLVHFMREKGALGKEQYMLILLFMGSRRQPQTGGTHEKSSTGNIRVLMIGVSLLQPS